MLPRKPLDVDVADSPFYPFAVRDLSVSGLKYFHGHAKHKQLKEWKKRTEQHPLSDEDSARTNLSPDSIFAEYAGRELRGLPIPTYVNREVYHVSATKRWGYPKGCFPTLWCLCMNDIVTPGLLLLFPARWREHRKGQAIVDYQDVEYLENVSNGRPDLRIERLYVWHELITTREKQDQNYNPNKKNFRQFLHVPVP